MGQVSLASPDLDFRSGHFVEVRGFQVKCYTDPSLLAGHLSGQCRKERTWNTMKMGTTLGSRSLAWKSLSIHSYGTFQPAGTAGRLATVSPKLCLVSLTRPGIAILAPSSSSYILAKHEARHSQRGPGRTDGAKLPPLEDGGMEKGECVSRHLKSEGLMPKTILCSSSTSPQDAPRETFSPLGHGERLCGLVLELLRALLLGTVRYDLTLAAPAAGISEIPSAEASTNYNETSTTRRASARHASILGHFGPYWTAQF